MLKGHPPFFLLFFFVFLFGIITKKSRGKGKEKETTRFNFFDLN